MFNFSTAFFFNVILLLNDKPCQNFVVLCKSYDWFYEVDVLDYN